MSTSQRMRGINVRMEDDLVAELDRAAAREQRTLRQFIRNVLRLDMAERGLLDYEDVAAPLLTAQQIADAATP